MSNTNKFEISSFILNSPSGSFFVCVGMVWNAWMDGNMYTVKLYHTNGMEKDSIFTLYLSISFSYVHMSATVCIKIMCVFLSLLGYCCLAHLKSAFGSYKSYKSFKDEKPCHRRKKLTQNQRLFEKVNCNRLLNLPSKKWTDKKEVNCEIILLPVKQKKYFNDLFFK